MVLGEAWLYRDICPAFEKKLKTEEDILKLGLCFNQYLMNQSSIQPINSSICCKGDHSSAFVSIYNATAYHSIIPGVRHLMSRSVNSIQDARITPGYFPPSKLGKKLQKTIIGEINCLKNVQNFIKTQNFSIF